MSFAGHGGRHLVDDSEAVAENQELLAAAQGGDERAFAELLGGFWAELHAHCYRMLGSVHDADDAWQEVLLRAWRGLSGFEGRSSFRRWLYRVATNVCLTMIAKRAKRVLPMDLSPAAEAGDGLAEPLAESVWLEPYPDSMTQAFDSRFSPDARIEQRENIELAFVAALQHLPGNERAALLLREVIGFSAREVAELVDATVPAVNSALQRARRIVNDHIQPQVSRSTARSKGDTRLRKMVDDYIEAFERGDIDALVALLTDDVTWSMPPTATWYRGRAAITRFLTDGPMRVRWRHLATVANGQPAVACYIWDPQRQAYVAQVLDVLTLRGERIAAVTAFIDSRLFPRFGLPEVLPA
jgi:RNA polymerase sigma-70 factor (ECF subfamily)